MFTTIITDCYEDNEAGRQITRFNSLNLGPTSLLGVGSNFSDDATLEGGVNLIDILDATLGKEGVVVLNVAPRGNKSEGENGNPFSYFYYKKTLVISTIKGHCLSYVKKLGIADEVNLLELKDVLEYTRNKNLINRDLEKYITNTQFRSFDFVPRLARWILDKVNVPSKIHPLNYAVSETPRIWCIDAFGNAKTTTTASEHKLKPRQKVKTNYGELKYYDRLKDVPHNETAIYTGSSGIGDYRFLEITTQGIPGSAAQKLNLKIGDTLLIN